MKAHYTTIHYSKIVIAIYKEKICNISSFNFETRLYSCVTAGILVHAITENY